MEPLHITDPTNPITGLTQAQAQAAPKNSSTDNTGKSYPVILREHIFTFFNIINFILGGLVFLTGSYRNMLFLVVVFSNIAIGLFQEIRSRRILNRLALISQQKSVVIRDGRQESIYLRDIADGDIIVLSAGDEIPCDGVIVSGQVQVNESMLTGESDPIDKYDGGSVYAGCFIIAGKAKMQAVRVGDETYASRILKTAKRDSRYPSQLRDAMNTIIEVCTIILVPLGILLFLKTMFLSGQDLNSSILSTVAGMVGMIPEGLVILTSIALALSSVKLAKEDVLVQELYCIETLARVDTLCLDKTGTLTQGNMKVESILEENGYSRREIMQVLANLYASLDDDNVTAKALREYVKDVPVTRTSDKNFPFTSSNKCAGAVFGDTTYITGAYSFVFDSTDSKVEQQIEASARQGARILVLAKAPAMTHLQKGNYELMGLILIEDILRLDAGRILNYFKEQDVQVKIISGDMPQTVAAIAARAGVDGKSIDMSLVKEDQIARVVDEYTIFGRVTPDQKRDMILALKAQDHTVAMTGDGVNDVMALKEADCSIAMGSGTQAARSIASLVLLHDQFDAMPSILLEGRRVINNIQRTASLFLVKTLFSVGLTLLAIFWFSRYPFEPIQLTLVSSLGVGFPAFMLTLEPNYARVKGNFLHNVLSNAIPGALSVVSLVALTRVMLYFLPGDMDVFSTLCTWIAGVNALWVLRMVCNPMTTLRRILCISMTAFFLFCGIILHKVFLLEVLRWWQLIYILVLAAVIPLYLNWLHSLPWKKTLRLIDAFNARLSWLSAPINILRKYIMR